MVQLSILSGKQAGNQTVVRRLPFSIGRSGGNDLQLDDEGVWEKHLTLEFQGGDQFVAQTAAGALVALNHEPVLCVPLRNGDVLSLGSVKLQFWLAATSQRGLKLRESLVWGLLAAVTAAQLALIYWLCH
jgi:pSer/pThr/pTyr-binding forkhead associated (FHA) protein